MRKAKQKNAQRLRVWKRDVLDTPAFWAKQSGFAFVVNDTKLHFWLRILWTSRNTYKLTHSRTRNTVRGLKKFFFCNVNHENVPHTCVARRPLVCRWKRGLASRLQNFHLYDGVDFYNSILRWAKDNESYFFLWCLFFLHKLPLHAHIEMASVRQTVRQQKVPLLTNGRNKKKTISTTTSLSFHETICFHLSPGGGKNSYGRRTAGRRSEIMFKMSTGRPFLHCTQPEIIAMNQQSRPVLLAYVDRVAFPTSLRYKVPKWTALWNRVFFAGYCSQTPQYIMLGHFRVAFFFGKIPTRLGSNDISKLLSGKEWKKGITARKRDWRTNMFW